MSGQPINGQSAAQSNISPLAVLSMGLAVGLALVFVAGQKLAGVPPTQVTASTPVEQRAIRFEDQADGSIAVYDMGADRPYEVVAPQTGGFLRGTLRGMARARKLSHADKAPPFVLTHWADGPSEPARP